jgi:hypothetical protein
MSNRKTRESRRNARTFSIKGRAPYYFPAYIVILALSVCIAAAPSFAQTGVLTQHNDIGRTGQNTAETTLTPTNVKVGVFGKLFALPVTGQVYAQPLYVPNVSIAGVMHNVVIVATEADMVYAFDADSNTGANALPLWAWSMVDMNHGGLPDETPLISSSTIGCTDMQPQIGISATPVVDTASQTIYVEAKSDVVSKTAPTTYYHRLHALSLTTGLEKFSASPVVIAASVSGTGDGSKNGTLSFDNLHQMARPGLLELNGAIYIAYASHCDDSPYHGWIFAYDTTSFTQKSLFVTTPNGGLGGFWMSGAGIAADANSNIFIPSGNGDFNGVPATEFSDTILKFGTTNETLSVLDYFTPSDQACLQGSDEDLGSGGLLVLPTQTGAAFPDILVQAGKEGNIYVVNRDVPITTTPSHYQPPSNGSCSSVDPEIVEESGSGAIGGMWGSPAYWNSTLYFWGAGDVLKSIPVVSGLPDFGNISRGSFAIGFPGSTPAVSANGAEDGIVWAIDASAYGPPAPKTGPAILHAINATSLTDELWNSTQAAMSADQAGNAVKFTVPTIANGKVYIGTSTEVDVYGLLSSGPQPPAVPAISPGSETVSAPVHVSITDSTTGAAIYYTTNNTMPTTSSTLYTRPFPIATTSTVQAIAALNGVSSGVDSVTYTFGAAVAAPTFSPASGTFTGSAAVTISDATGGSTIYYTTDGSTPKAGVGTTQQYTGTITLTKSTALKAIAVVGSASSTVATSAYRIKAGT